MRHARAVEDINDTNTKSQMFVRDTILVYDSLANVAKPPFMYTPLSERYACMQDEKTKGKIVDVQIYTHSPLCTDARLWLFLGINSYKRI